jgi:hypothetical protein
MGTLVLGTVSGTYSPEEKSGAYMLSSSGKQRINIVPEYTVFSDSATNGAVYDSSEIYDRSGSRCLRPESIWIPPCQINTQVASSDLEEYKIYSVMIVIDRDKAGGILGVNNALTAIHTCKIFRYLASPATKFEELRRLIAKSCGVSTSVIQTMPDLQKSVNGSVPEAPPARYYDSNFLTITSVAPGNAFKLTGQELVDKKLPSAQTSNAQYAKNLWNSGTLEGSGVSETGLICCQTFKYAY